MYLEIDNGGNQVSSNIFNRNGFCSGHAITTTHDGGIARVGERGNYNLWMYQWDSNNQPLEVTEQLGPGYGIEKTDDGGYVISTGSYIIKTDSEFNFDEWMNSEDEINQLPNQFELSQNYPNPFANTNIAYKVYEETFVQLIIYDILGNQIKELVNENQPMGDRIVSWKGDNNNGDFVTSGVYIYTFKKQMVQK